MQYNIIPEELREWARLHEASPDEWERDDWTTDDGLGRNKLEDDDNEL